MNENVEPLAGDDDEGGEEGKRQRSTIAFPYSDYQNAASLANTIYSNVGHGTCSSGQLAAWMNQSVKSSSYRMQVAAARLFGLIESDGPETLRLTALGHRINDPAQERAAKAEAFLQVPLFKRLYELHKDASTPPSAALEREIAGLGVAEKQKTRARQVFESSAHQTGFRESGANRLVMPAVVIKPATADLEKKGSEGGGNGEGSGGARGGNGAGEDGINLDPLLMALLRKIPTSDEGWPEDKRLRWFKTFAMNVSQVYDDDSAPVELVINVPKNNQ